VASDVLLDPTAFAGLYGVVAVDGESADVVDALTRHALAIELQEEVHSIRVGAGAEGIEANPLAGGEPGIRLHRTMDSPLRVGNL
jgi:hypothetical protein